MRCPKYFNTKTGEVCFNFKEVIHSIFTDLKHYPNATTWIFNWKRYKITGPCFTDGGIALDEA